jgi:hypothetical protein
MTFKDAIHILSSNLIMKILLPDWAQGATAHTRKVHLAFIELKVCCFNISALRPSHPSLLMDRAAIHAGNG